MVRICLCLTGRTLQQDLEFLERYREYIDIAELRVDCLEPDERLLIRRFPAMAGLPVILTVRRESEGGYFKGGEGARITLLSLGMAFAEIDPRMNFAYIDLEEDLNVPSLEEAARCFGTRIIRSFHNHQGLGDNLVRRIRALQRAGDEIPKAAVSPQNLNEVLELYQAARKIEDLEKIILGMGHFGVNTRILADKLGSCISYASVSGDPGLPIGAPGQLNPREMAETYRFRQINKSSKIYGVTGYPLMTSSSPPLFNQVFTEEHTNAVYLPFPAESLDSFMRLAAELGIEGVSVTVPYKEKVLPYLISRSDTVIATGACNTLLRTETGWAGHNTDALGFSDSLLAFTGRQDFRKVKITIIGAGGAARAVASELYRLKGKVLILNRTDVRAKRLAQSYGFDWGALDSEGLERMEHYRDIIIQTSSLGMAPHIEGDPLPEYNFKGSETVMDLIYNPERTRFLCRAEQAGCRVLNGDDMLFRQAAHQYRLFTGGYFPAHILSRIEA
ncbi:MAG: type I 3-dehydroquinate dehydratase [Treponema sp.]|jgi:3-dehydroquinate dehydratase/shikimate dehydrogenase|nr:type I 3-dehydroquinate dehydratase [Treponema sp.]